MCPYVDMNPYEGQYQLSHFYDKPLQVNAENCGYCTSGNTVQGAFHRDNKLIKNPSLNIGNPFLDARTTLLVTLFL